MFTIWQRKNAGASAIASNWKILKFHDFESCVLSECGNAEAKFEHKMAKQQKNGKTDKKPAKSLNMCGCCNFFNFSEI